MNKEYLHHLLAKYQSGQLSGEEKSALREFVQTDEGHKIINEIWDQSFEASHLDEDQVSTKKVLDRVLQDPRMLPQPIEVTLPSTKQWQRYASIAAAIVAVAFGVLYMIYQREGHTTAPALAQEEQVFPGSDKARIVFDDGTFVELNSLSQDTLIADQGLRIFKKEDGSIAYEYTGPQVKEVYNTIITPRGGEYSLLLPDGSQVWVNADSKLRYPLAFSKDVREVELEGEAYFDVKKSFRNGVFQPFIVNTGQQRLEVLGTSFNINSYDTHIVTTLVEGSVSLGYEGKTDKNILKPAQQANFSKSSKKVHIDEVDPYYMIAWKEGKFAFDNASIHQVMRDVARWYDVEVFYEGDFSKVKYTGTISRFENFDQLLQLIEMTELVKFKKNGRRVTVMK